MLSVCDAHVRGSALRGTFCGRRAFRSGVGPARAQTLTSRRTSVSRDGQSDGGRASTPLEPANECATPKPESTKKKTTHVSPHPRNPSVDAARSKWK
eukprot:2434448-Prymnesium_polylepis.1